MKNYNGENETIEWRRAVDNGDELRADVEALWQPCALLSPDGYRAYTAIKRIEAELASVRRITLYGDDCDHRLALDVWASDANGAGATDVEKICEATGGKMHADERSDFDDGSAIFYGITLPHRHSRWWYSVQSPLSRRIIDGGGTIGAAKATTPPADARGEVFVALCAVSQAICDANAPIEFGEAAECYIVDGTTVQRVVRIRIKAHSADADHVIWRRCADIVDAMKTRCPVEDWRLSESVLCGGVGGGVYGDITLSEEKLDGVPYILDATSR